MTNTEFFARPEPPAPVRMHVQDGHNFFTVGNLHDPAAVRYHAERARLGLDQITLPPLRIGADLDGCYYLFDRAWWEAAVLLGYLDQHKHEYRPGENAFTGTVQWVQIDVDDKAEDVDHLITPEERWQIAMARQ